jgi:hypothetical protein
MPLESANSRRHDGNNSLKNESFGNLLFKSGNFSKPFLEELAAALASFLTISLGLSNQFAAIMLG